MIDMKKMGDLIQTLRKEKKMTQKQLADSVGVSDKAVSKWERGISIPDANLLEPISQQLGITLPELLHGERISDQISVEEADSLIKESLNLVISNETIEESKKKRLRLFIVTLIFTIMIMVLTFYNQNLFRMSIIIVVPMVLAFQFYFTFFVKETLPKYYDENKISYYTDGFIRLHVSGIYFNNRNWIPILHALCYGMSLCSVLIFIITLMTIQFKFNELFCNIGSLVILFLCLFVPLIIQAKRYSNK